MMILVSPRVESRFPANAAWWCSVSAAALLVCGACANQGSPMAPPSTAGTVATTAGVMAIAGSGMAIPAAGTAAAAAGTVATAGTAAVAGTAAISGAGGVGAAPSAATFTAVLAIFADSKNNCGLCHAMQTIGGGLVFNPTDRAGTYQALVGPTSQGTLGSQCAGKTYVVPGMPDSSLLYDKLSKATPSCGARMPASGAVLSDMEIETVRAWIAAGAMND